MNDAALTHAVTDPVAPLDAQMGTWPLLDVPPDMEDALLGPCPGSDGQDTDPPLFAIVEGARLPMLFDLIEEDDVPHATLFQGEVAEQLGEDVPVLVELKRGQRLLRLLLTDLGQDDAPTGLLPREAAFFFRSTADLAALRNHFRHFTQLPTEDPQKRIYFRFWEPASAALYFDHIGTDPGLVASWLAHPRAPIARVILPGRTPDGWLMHVFAPALPEGTQPAPVTLDAQTREVLRLARYNANVLEAVLLLLRTFPDPLAARAPRKLRSQVDRLYRRLIPLGFHSKQALFMLATWEVLYGPDFETRDPDGHLAHYLATPGREDDRIAALRARLESLPPDLFTGPPPAAA